MCTHVHSYFASMTYLNSRWSSSGTAFSCARQAPPASSPAGIGCCVLRTYVIRKLSCGDEEIEHSSPPTAGSNEPVHYSSPSTSAITESTSREPAVLIAKRPILFNPNPIFDPPWKQNDPQKRRGWMRSHPQLQRRKYIRATIRASCDRMAFRS